MGSPWWARHAQSFAARQRDAYERSGSLGWSEGEDVNDTTPGKDRALFQVNEFLQWLDEAAEEEGEENSEGKG